MILELAATFLVRIGQILAAAMPTILLGMLTAGVFVRVIGADRIRRWIATGTWADAPRAWVIGILLPVCPLGVIPVLFVLRRMGVGVGVLAIVALSGPLVTPWTIGYLADRAGWTVAAIALAGNALVATVAFLSMGGTTRGTSAAPGQALGDQRMLLGTLAAAGRSLTPQAAAAIGVAVLGAGIVAMCIPPNAVGEWLVERSLENAAVITAVSMGAVVLPPTVSLHAGEIARGSTMPGLLTPVISLAAGVNLGVLVLAWASAGARRTVVALMSALVVACTAGALVDRAIHDPAYAPEDTHAFEDLGRPFHLLDHPDGAVAGWWHRFTRAAGTESVGASAGVLVLLLLARTARAQPMMPCPAPLGSGALRIASGIGAVAVVLGVLYSYYPPPSTATREIRVLFSEIASSDSEAEVTRLRQRILHRTGQLHGSAILYGQPLRESQRAAIHRLEERIAHRAAGSSTRLADDDIEALRAIGSLSGSQQ
jgi:uncharacterized protein